MLAQPHSNDLVASPSEPTPAAGHRWALLVSFCGSDPLSWVALLVTGCGSLGALAVAPSRQRRTMVAFGLLALAVYAFVAVALA
jgi:nitrate reductase NapE component